MGLTAGIDIKFSVALADRVNAITVLQRAGWRVNNPTSKNIIFLPVGDNGMYDWQSISITEWATVATIITEQQRLGEASGIYLTYDDTQCDFIFAADQRSLSIAINNVNRKLLPDCSRFTDYSWYIQRIVCPLGTAILGGIETFACSDYV